jgi:hypothetical protein
MTGSHSCPVACGQLDLIRRYHSVFIFAVKFASYPKWRNRNIGRSLLVQLKIDFPNLTVYALSDKDAYYERIGHKRIGSEFER